MVVVCAIGPLLAIYLPSALTKPTSVRDHCNDTAKHHNIIVNNWTPKKQHDSFSVALSLEELQELRLPMLPNHSEDTSFVTHIRISVNIWGGTYRA